MSKGLITVINLGLRSLGLTIMQVLKHLAEQSIKTSKQNPPTDYSLGEGYFFQVFKSPDGRMVGEEVLFYITWLASTKSYNRLVLALINADYLHITVKHS